MLRLGQAFFRQQPLALTVNDDANRRQKEHEGRKNQSPVEVPIEHSFASLVEKEAFQKPDRKHCPRKRIRPIALDLIAVGNQYPERECRGTKQRKPDIWKTGLRI